ncbi:hypothetical protein L873DRAFT_659852 [Choiromyces venosus 120613-1]|uniref:Reverse transcriptase Ty1/copia-type domain-containing protein n=1 Tax=Choiromyces venosus 120613-1 TaxID=1336337 RepID=A0A3N4J6D3_9PEZI|nr:hypothetical protein L873DRAFT_659852 [Choiromyces venosus 120613-1]
MINLVLTLVVGFDWEAECFDVCSTFLGSLLEEGLVVYLHLHKGVDFDFDMKRLVLEKEENGGRERHEKWGFLLRKSIYGLK